MIFEFKVKNYLSFKDEVTFSFEATRDKHLEGHHVVEVKPGIRILKLGMVYGANASGKSNLLEAFGFMYRFWFKSTENKDEKTGLIPFLLDDTSRNEPSEFSLIFFINIQKYVYSLRLTDSEVISETLVNYPGAQPAEIFSRKNDKGVSNIRFNRKFKIDPVAEKEIKVKCLSNMSLFAAYNKVNVQVAEMDAVVDWMKYHIIGKIGPETSSMEADTKKLLLKNSLLKDDILKYLSEADFNISGIDIKSKEKPVPEAFISFFEKFKMPADALEKLQKEGILLVSSINFNHKIWNKEGEACNYDLPETLESRGTMRTMGLAGTIIQAINQNAFLSVDEIDTSIHPKLIEFIIEHFLKRSETSQLLFTTHYDGLLEEEDLLRKDNIWFTNKRKDGSTELYSLSDFKGTGRISSLQKAYKYGKFGAVPNI